MQTYNLIEIKEDTVKQTCYVCPTLFEWEDKNDRKYYFRLRHGFWRIVDETEEEYIIASGVSDDRLDGCCDWEDVKRYALKENLIIQE